MRGRAGLVAAAGYLAVAQLAAGPTRRRAARRGYQAAAEACRVEGWCGGAGRPCVAAALAMQTGAAWMLNDRRR